MFDVPSVSLRIRMNFMSEIQVCEKGLKMLFVYFASFVNFDTHSLNVNLIVVGKNNYAELVYCVFSTIFKFCNQMLS
jgi:hypothetical protein